MSNEESKQTKKKFLEGIGCLFYIIAAGILLAVFIAHWDNIFQ